MNKIRKRLLLALALLLLLLAGLGAMRRIRADRQLERVKELRGRMTGQARRNLTREQRRDLWRQMREAMDKLTPEQRRALMAERRQAMRERLGRFFKLSKEEQEAELDRRIQRMEEMRQRRDAANRSAGASPGTGGLGRGDRPGWGSLSEADRDLRRKMFLDNTTAEDRAQWSLYRQMLNQRRQELGLPPRGRP
jgi:hypothetical protein